MGKENRSPGCTKTRGTKRLRSRQNSVKSDPECQNIDNEIHSDKLARLNAIDNENNQQNSDIESTKEELISPKNLKNMLLADTLNQNTAETTTNSCRRSTRNASFQEAGNKQDIYNTPTKILSKVGSIKDKDTVSPITSIISNLRSPKSESERYSPCQKRRKISLASEYDQLSDIIKSELADPSRVTDFDHIDMVHDLDTVINFEQIQMPEIDVLPEELDANEEHAQSNVDGIIDPTADPLYIEDHKEEANKKKIQTRLTHLVTKKLDDRRVTPARKLVHDQRTDTKILRNSQSKMKEESDENSKDDLSDTEDDDFSVDFEEALADLKINLIHTVPPQHKIEHTAGSRMPSLKQRLLFETYGPLRKDNYSPKEDEIIRKNWQDFCKEHLWNPKDVQPFLYMRHGNKYYVKGIHERQKFVQFLANGLPWRTLHSVHCRFRVLYEQRPKLRTRYTGAEDKKILTTVEKQLNNQDNANHNVFAKLAAIMGRPRRSIFSRYKKLLRKKKLAKRSRIIWTLPLISNFLKNLMSLTLSEDVQELKDAVIIKAVWLKLEKKLKIRYEALQSLWFYQLHMQLFCPHPIYLNDLKIQLIEYLYGKGISSEREIRWRNVAKCFDGFTTLFLSLVFSNLVRDVHSKYRGIEFPDVMEKLYEYKIAEIRDNDTDRYLPRLSYKNGELKFVDKQPK